MTAYQTFCKPALAKALHSVGMDRVFHRAEGAHLYYLDAQGRERRVLDLLGGYGAVLMGHNPPQLVEKARALLAENIAFHNQFSIRNGAAQLAAELNPLLRQQTGWQEDFMLAFTNSGAESVEVAIKHAEIIRGHKLEQLKQELLAADKKLQNVMPAACELDGQDRQELGLEENQNWADIGAAVREYNARQLSRGPLFVALKYAFHGKLTGTIQLTYGERYRQPFYRLGLNVRFMTPAEIEQQMERLLEQECAWLYEPVLVENRIAIKRRPLPLIGALLAEPVQGEGGVYCLTEQQVSILHTARDKWQCPLIADEVQSGCGRCGALLAGSQIGLKPDYVVLSKALGGGIAKLGVVAVRKSAYATGFDLIQSSTFAEDDFSALIALEYVRRLEQNNGEIYRRVTDLGNRIKQQLLALKADFPDVIADVRGKGLLLGVEFADQSDADSHMLKTVAYQGAMGYLLSGHLLNEAGIRVAPPASAANVVRLEPGIEISEQDIEHLLRSLANVCLALRYQDAHFLLRFLTWEQDTPVAGELPRDYREYYFCKNHACHKNQAGRTRAVAATGDETVKVAKVAFINHLISPDWLGQVDPSFTGVGAAEADRMLERMSFDRRSVPFAPVRITSSQGNAVDFILYPLTVTSAQIEEMLANNDLEEIRAAIDERIASARDDGCQVAGLGMFTSIVTNNAKAVNAPGIHLTTGNALTVAMAAQALKKVGSERNQATDCAAVVGAAGNIGSVYASLLAEEVSRLILIGSGRQGSVNRLLRTAHSVYEDCWTDLLNDTAQSRTGIAAQLGALGFVQQWLKDPAARPAGRIGQALREAVEKAFGEDPFILVSDSLEVLREADIVLCAANSAEAFIDPQLIKQNALLCDIAVPHNLSQEMLAGRPDLACVRGGIVGTPYGESLDPRARAYLREGQIYACMAETVVLGLEGYNGNYSYGNLKREQVRAILQMAQAHGFDLATVKTGESM